MVPVVPLDIEPPVPIVPVSEPLVPIEPPPVPMDVPLVPGVLPGGLCVGDVVAFGSMVGWVGPEPLCPCMG